MQSGMPVFQGRDCAFVSRIKKIAPVRDNNNNPPGRMREKPASIFMMKDGTMEPSHICSTIMKIHRNTIK